MVELTKQNAKGKVVSKTTFEATVADTSRGESSHKATITGLTEDSNYSYRIGDGNGNWTKSYEFETQDTEEFNFLFMVLNIQSTDNSEHKQAMEQAIAANPDVKNKIVALHKSIYSTVHHFNYLHHCCHEPSINGIWHK